MLEKPIMPERMMTEREYAPEDGGSLEDIVYFFEDQEIPIGGVEYTGGVFRYHEEESDESLKARLSEYWVEMAMREKHSEESRDELIEKTRGEIVALLLESHKEIDKLQAKYYERLEKLDKLLTELESGGANDKS